MARRPRISIWWDSDEYVCQFSFSYEIVDFLRSLPRRDRRSNDDDKTWSFRSKHLDAVLFECRRLGFQIERLDIADAEDWPSRTEPNSTELLLVNFFRMVPKEAMRRAYCAAALTLHPDRGGDTADMQRLNDLWQRIEKEWYATENPR
jgi:hypothetical protein